MLDSKIHSTKALTSGHMWRVTAVGYFEIERYVSN